MQLSTNTNLIKKKMLKLSFVDHKRSSAFQMKKSLMQILLNVINVTLNGIYNAQIVLMNSDLVIY